MKDSSTFVVQELAVWVNRYLLRHLFVAKMPKIRANKRNRVKIPSDKVQKIRCGDDGGDGDADDAPK